jgi:hypothetical protein
MPFRPGQSGNPRGRAPGTKNKRTLELEKFRGLARRELIRRVRAGDPIALGYLLDRVYPRLRPVAPTIRLGATNTRDLSAFGRRVLRRLAQGRISADTAAVVLGSLTAQAALIDHVDLVKRIELLEQDDERTERKRRSGNV